MSPNVVIYVNKDGAKDRFAVRVDGVLVFHGHSIGAYQLDKICKYLTEGKVDIYRVDNVEVA